MGADSTELEDIEIYTPIEMLVEGLKVLGWDETNMTSTLTIKTKKDRFRGHYGSNPDVAAQMWEDLQTTTVQAARIDPSKRNLLHFSGQCIFLESTQKARLKRSKFGRCLKTHTLTTPGTV